MCFSAEASFLASGLLLPTGLAALAATWRQGHRDRWPLAIAPLAFGVQQACEGVVWHWIETQPPLAPEPAPGRAVAASLSYLFFAYAFWPVWMPLAAVALRPRAGLAGLLWRATPWLGGVAGVLLWLPLLADPGSALPEPVGHSLVYPVGSWGEGRLPPLLGPMLYAAWIVLPLLAVPSWRVRTFALTLLLAFALTEWTSRHALTSVWCFASALLSLQLVWILLAPSPRRSPPPGSPLPQPQP
jgi:hypothetical protein